MELLKEHVAVPCWECHEPTRTRPCEHCRCDNPEANRAEYEAERVLIARVMSHLVNRYRLRVPFDVEQNCTLEPDPRHPDFTAKYPRTLESVPLRIVEIMKRQKLICQLTENGKDHRIGWREMGVDGTVADWYTCMQ